MVLAFPILSSLYIKDSESETYIYFSYLQQPKKCHKCGSGDHLVDQCDVYRTTKPKDRENAVDLDHEEVLDSNRNRTESGSSSSSSDTDEMEDSKSGLSSESETESDTLRLSPSQTVRLNILDDNAPECDYTPRLGINPNDHMSDHIVETDTATKKLISEIVKSPPNNSYPQIPVPRARMSYSRSYQPASIPSVNNKRRELSVSPENTSEILSKPKTGKVARLECLV